MSPSTSPRRPPPSACATTRWTSPSPLPTSGSWSCCARGRWTRSSTAPSSRTHAGTPAYAHELESIGTPEPARGGGGGRSAAVILRSFTAVYGARGQNPNFLTEDHPLPPSPTLGWVRDKLEAEQHAAAFARRYPGLSITVLRFAPLLGPGVHTFYTRIFDHRVVPLLMGYDPLVQLLHPEDALTAFLAAVEAARRGLQRRAQPAHPDPHRVSPGREGSRVRAAPDRLRRGRPPGGRGLGAAPGGFVDYVRHLFVADGEKARPRWASCPAGRAAIPSPPTSGIAIRDPPFKRRRPREPEREGGLHGQARPAANGGPTGRRGRRRTGGGRAARPRRSSRRPRPRR